MSKDYDIEKVTRYSVNGRDFTSLAAAKREVLHYKLSRTLNLNFEGISSHWESVLYDRIIENRKLILNLLEDPKNLEP